jgi:hypothetical protein
VAAVLVGAQIQCALFLAEVKPVINASLEKEAWAEGVADKLTLHIDRLAKAHAMNDARVAEDECNSLWSELKALIIAVDVRNHVIPAQEN